jgi:hypothetical protein
LCGTLGRSTHSLALGAFIFFASFLRATNGALRLFALDLTFGTRTLVALDFTLARVAQRVAVSRTDGVVTLPTALRVALGRFGGRRWL